MTLRSLSTFLRRYKFVTVDRSFFPLPTCTLFAFGFLVIFVQLASAKIDGAARHPILDMSVRRKGGRRDENIARHRRTKGHHHRRSFPVVHTSKEGLIDVTSSTTPELSSTPSMPWSDEQIITDLMKKYRYPDTSINISVALSMSVDRILSGEHIDQLCRLQISLTQKWREIRLQYTEYRDNNLHAINLRSRIRLLNHIWHPTLNIENALSVALVGKEKLRLFSNGVVELTQVLQVITEAKTDFHAFPFDNRICYLFFSNDDSRAVWNRISINTPTQIDPPQEQDNEAAEFRIIGASSRRPRVVCFRMRRNAFTWVYRLFVPCVALLCTFWFVVCWRESVGRRARDASVSFISSTLFVSILIMIFLSIERIPMTNYFKAIDLWNAAVFFSALATLILNVRIVRATSTYGGPTRFGCELKDGVCTQLQMPYYTRLRKRPYGVGLCVWRTIYFSAYALPPLFFAAFLVYFTLSFIKPFYASAFNDHC